MKIYLTSIFLIITMSCKDFNSKNENTRKIINYYHGIVLNENDEVLSDVDVTLLDSNKIKVATNDKGYFQIKDKNFTEINVQEDKNIIFSKKGYVVDTVSTFLIGPNYLPRNSRFYHYFIYEVPDTIRLKRKRKS